MLQNARNSFISAQNYFSELAAWTENPGVNPADVIPQQEILESAIKNHDMFRSQVEEVYAQAIDDATKVTKALKEADVEDNVAREHTSRLQRAHKHLMDKWKERHVGESQMF